MNTGERPIVECLDMGHKPCAACHPVCSMSNVEKWPVYPFFSGPSFYLPLCPAHLEKWKR